MIDPEDPPRLVDPASSAAPELRRLLEQSRADVGSTTEIQKLEGLLAPVLWPGSPGPAAAKAAAAKGAAALAIKVGAGAIVIAGASAVWLGAGHEGRPSAPSAVTANARPATPSAPIVVPVSPPPASAAGEAEVGTEEADVPGAETLSPTGSNVARRPLVGSVSEKAHQTAEADLLGQAQAALSSDPARALALAQRHASQFAHGLLVQEREVIAVEALGRLGRTSDAKARGERFLRQFPSSAYRSKIEGIVGVQ